MPSKKRTGNKKKGSQSNFAKLSIFQPNKYKFKKSCPLSIKGAGKIIKELEKNEAIDKNLLRYMTVKVKKFDLEAKYFSKKDEYEKKEYKRN